jgi:hypothetical protein
MTAQMMEVIYIDGKRHYMASEPMEQYLGKLENAPSFISSWTSCWRGYFGNWKIKDNKLYLTGLNGWIKTPEENQKEIDLDYLFPNKKKVFADWFSGEIRIPLGQLDTWIDREYESVNGKRLIINIKNGYVISKTEISNV